MATPEVRPQQVGPGLMSRMILLGPWHLGWLGITDKLMAISGGDYNIVFAFKYGPEARNCKGWPLE